MIISRLTAIIWKRAGGIFRRNSKRRDERVAGPLTALNEEAPLHTDGFYNRMRSFGGPFFE
jgi:hypothetical protein